LLSLKEKSTAKVIDSVLHNDPSDLSWVSEAEQLPGFAAAVKAKMLANPALVEAPSGKELLSRALEGNSFIDLTPFEDITVANVVEIVNGIVKQKPSNAITLVLPDVHIADADELAAITHWQSVQKLHPDITEPSDLKSILKLVKSSSITELNHAHLYSRAFDMSKYSWEPSPLHDMQNDATPHFPSGAGTSFPLSQILYLTGSSVVALPLSDALLTLTNIASTLPTDFEILAARDTWMLSGSFGTGQLSIGIVKQMAISSHHRIMPLPGLLHSAAEATSSSSAAPSIKSHDVRPGQWTLLACHERKDPPAFRYAFVTVDEEDKIRPLSADDFFKETTSVLEDVVALAARWKAGENALGKATATEVAVCDSEDVGRALVMVKQSRAAGDRYRV